MPPCAFRRKPCVLLQHPSIFLKKSDNKTDFGFRPTDTCYYKGVRSGEPLLWEWLALALLEGSYFVNAASLMMLASILEKREQGAKHKGTEY